MRAFLFVRRSAPIRTNLRHKFIWNELEQTKSARRASIWKARVNLFGTKLNSQGWSRRDATHGRGAQSRTYFENTMYFKLLRCCFCGLFCLYGGPRRLELTFENFFMCLGCLEFLWLGLMRDSESLILFIF